MAVIEHRRHTMRVIPGEHLSQAGVDLARMVSTSVQAFDVVVTSPVTRAIETAIAMGYAVSEYVEELAMFPESLVEQVNWDAGFAGFSNLVRSGLQSPAAKHADMLKSVHSRIAQGLGEGGRALVISHGWVVEMSAVGCLGNVDFTGWGDSCDYCEGFRVEFRDGEFTAGEPLRIPRVNGKLGPDETKGSV